MPINENSFLAAQNWLPSPLVFNDLNNPVERGFFSSGTAEFRRFSLSQCNSTAYINVSEF